MTLNVSRHNIHRNWYIHQEFLFEQRKYVDREIQRKLEQLILHGYSKVSTINSIESQRLGLQATPCFFDEAIGYHRVTRNDLLDKVDGAFAKSIGVKLHELRVISSPLLLEVIEREIFQDDSVVNITSFEQFGVSLDKILTCKRLGCTVLINCSQLMSSDSVKNKEIVRLLEDIAVEKIHSHFGEKLKVRREEIAREFLGHLHLFGFVEYQQECLLLMPEFFLDSDERFDAEINDLLHFSCVRNRHGRLDRLFNSMISRNGYRLSPAEAKVAWLKVSSLEDILTVLCLTTKLSKTEKEIPQVCESFQGFLKQPIVGEFYRQSLGAFNSFS